MSEREVRSVAGRIAIAAAADAYMYVFASTGGSAGSVRRGTFDRVASADGAGIVGGVRAPRPYEAESAAMNRKFLGDNVGNRVQLVPIAQRIDESGRV